MYCMSAYYCRYYVSETVNYELYVSLLQYVLCKRDSKLCIVCQLITVGIM